MRRRRWRRRGRTARIDVRAVVAVRRRQDHAGARADERRRRPADVGVGDDAADAARRSRRQGLLFHRQAALRCHGEEQRAAGHAPVFDHFYGTPRAPVEAALAAGATCCSTSTGRARSSCARRRGSDVVSVFILPPSAADLEKRLHTRAQDSDDVIRGRMSRASHEMSHWAEYDYIVVNRQYRHRLRGGQIDPHAPSSSNANGR